MDLEALKVLAWDWRYGIVVVIGLLVYVIFEWKKVKEILKLNIIAARARAKQYVLESGQEQEDWVVDTTWKFLPLPVTVFLTPFGGKDALRKLVKIVYNGLKDYLDNGLFDNSNRELEQE